MRLFIFLLLQVLLILPQISLAESTGSASTIQDERNAEITAAQKAEVINSYGKLPLYFIENKGQVDGQVSFYERGAGHATYFTRDGVVIALTKREGKAQKTSRHDSAKKDMKTERPAEAATEALTLSFVGGNKEAAITAGQPMDGRVNYFIGKDKKKWRSNIPTYGAVTYNGTYKNIDIKFYGNNRNIEHDVIVRPGGDISKVIFAYKGVQGLNITEEGDLEVSLKQGKIIEQKPVIYQDIKGERVVVDGSYKLLGKRDGIFTYGFDVASYDHDKTIVIDPVLTYSTYLGGSGSDSGYGIAVDASGNAYVTGETLSSDFPLAIPIQGVHGGVYDAFVTKINPAGSALVYSTYLGSSNYDIGNGIAVDASGNAYVTGETRSVDFPLMNPIQATYGGGFVDAFITKINPTGSALVYSTYLGGSDREYSYGIAVDASGNAYVTGETVSSDFPLMNPIQGVIGMNSDAFITKVNPAGSALVYSTYLGGSNYDIGNGIAVDSTEAAYLTGQTWSTDFPLVAPVQGIYGGGGSDAFVTNINPAGSALVYSTYLGGSDQDSGWGIAVDASGSAYVTGDTLSTDFPLVAPVQGINGGGRDAFVTNINPAGSAFVYSTYLGGNDYDVGNGIAVDASGNAYVTGYTWSTDFPLVAPIQGINGGWGDNFITKVNPAGSAFVYSTYLGGSSRDYGNGIAVDGVGSAYVTGYTSSPDFPLMSPVQGIHGGGLYDAFITKISVTPPPPLPVVTVALTPDTVSVARGATLGYTITATNTTEVEQCFNYWENVTLPDGSTYPPTGELFGPIRSCFPAGTSQPVHLTHGVPMAAPVGAYIFNAYVGAYSFPELPVIVDEDHFNFDVTAFNPATKNPETSWRLLENGFRK